MFHFIAAELFSFVNRNAAATNSLADPIVVDQNFATILIPDFDPEGVRAAIRGPQHELVRCVVGCQRL